ncbi:hypothetical protein GJ496_008134 [Pomphorhynchus laevis]|nr:hypothetical protein GJ496_008134 [Pomphorhynchus laevis]
MRAWMQCTQSSWPSPSVCSQPRRETDDSMILVGRRLKIICNDRPENTFLLQCISAAIHKGKQHMYPGNLTGNSPVPSGCVV